MSAPGSDSSLVSSDLEQPLFQSHKSLPRRREIVIRIFASDEDGHLADGTGLVTAPLRPPTPPDPTQKDCEWERQGVGSSRSDHHRPAIKKTTPSKPSHPPTPEKTPPRASVNRSGTNQFRQASHASSHAESFQTAREIVSSDTDGDIPRRSSKALWRSPRQNAYSQSSLDRSEHSLARTPRQEAKYRSSQLDNAETPPQSGSKKARRNGACESAIDSSLKRERSRKHDHHPVKGTRISRPVAMSVTDEQVPESPLTQVHDRAKETDGPVPNLSLEEFRKEIGWPSFLESPDANGHQDSQRLSGVSTASTVEAMIVDGSARSTKRTLRHTEKRSSLRSASSPVTKSERTSLASDLDSQHRLVHKAARITERDRKSIASEISISAGPTVEAPHQTVDIVPVVVIPERQSSLRSSSSTSRNPSKASSQRSSRRVTTSPGSRASSLGPPHKKKQTISDTVPVFLQNTDFKGYSVRRPTVPPRRSSLSAPTSTNNSRATSLTSESLHSHTLTMEEVEQKRRAEQLLPEPLRETEAPKTQSILIGVEDMTSLRNPSMPNPSVPNPSMPLSLGSMPSSPGTFELNEATAVSLFPHNNESLLLVDQQMRREKQKARQVDSWGKLDAASMQTKPRQDVDDIQSPLRNPRPAPQPPIFQVIPPSPMKELEQKSNSNTREPGFRRFGSLRRAWSHRSRSESTNPTKQSFPTSATNRKAGKEIDSRLHPFWHPRRFWDDEDDSSPKSYDSPPKSSSIPTYHTSNENDQIVKNSLGIPQPRGVMDGPFLPTTTTTITAATRPEETRKRLYDPALNRSTLALGNTSRVFSTRASLPFHQRGFGFVSRWGYRTQSMTVRNLRKRVRRRLQQREELKGEMRRAKLKRSIGDVVRVELSGRNGVLSKGL